MAILATATLRFECRRRRDLTFHAFLPVLPIRWQATADPCSSPCGSPSAANHEPFQRIQVGLGQLDGLVRLKHDWHVDGFVVERSWKNRGINGMVVIKLKRLNIFEGYKLYISCDLTIDSKFMEHRSNVEPSNDLTLIPCSNVHWEESRKTHTEPCEILIRQGATWMSGNS